METTPAPEYYYESDSRRFFRRRHNTTAAVALGLLLFLMPFAELRCGNIPIIRNSGLGLAFGSSWRPAMGGMPDKKDLVKKDTTGDFQKSLSSGPNVFAIVALVAAILALVICLSSTRSRSLVVLSASALTALMLIALLVQMQISFSNAMNKASDLAAEKKGDMGEWSSAMTGMIKLHFTLWYYISLVSFMAAAFFGYKHHRIEFEDSLRAAQDFEFTGTGEVKK